MPQKQSRGHNWKYWSDEKLLGARMCDLGLTIEGTKLAPLIEELYRELKEKGLRFTPHFWLSEEFFVPSDAPGIAIPFYLAHPSLEKLEKKMMFEVEGGTRNWAMRILRHEAGHAIENAFRLNRRKDRRMIFGPSSKKYPDKYAPKPFSRSFVMNLENWYGQSHPDEDFAETFAVWLDPKSNWRFRYKRWPAHKKLLFMDQLMSGLVSKKPSVTSKAKTENISTIKKTLRQHYQEKQERFSVNVKQTFYDRDLRKIFSDAPEFQANLRADRFIRRYRKTFRRKVSFWTGQYQYTIDEVLWTILRRCKELNLHLKTDEQTAQEDAQALLTVKTMNYLHEGGYLIAV